MGNPSSGVVTATGSIVWPGWVGAMNWFMITSTSASFHVGMEVPPMIKAVESADSLTAGDTVETGTRTTVAITTSTATPIDTVIRVAA
jgi:hypothetical protein